MKAIFHPEAHEEMTESARFYERKSEGFGSDCLTAVEQATRLCLKSLRRNPKRLFLIHTAASARCYATRCGEHRKPF